MDSPGFDDNLVSTSPPKGIEDFWPKQQSKITRMTTVLIFNLYINYDSLVKFS